MTVAAELTPARRTELAKARLAENGGVCDECEDGIGRWTSKCAYDPEADRAYCNKNGCAEAWREAPRCEVCGKTVMKGTSISGMTLCKPCYVDGDAADAEPKDADRVPLTDAMRASLTVDEVDSIEAGPYEVFRAAYTYQIGRAAWGKVDVRGTRATAEDAFRACATFNDKYPDPPTEDEIITLREDRRAWDH